MAVLTPIFQEHEADFPVNPHLEMDEFANRRPLLYHHDTNTVHVGAPGALHSDLEEKLYDDDRTSPDQIVPSSVSKGWIGRNPDADESDHHDPGGNLGWYSGSTVPSYISDAVKDRYDLNEQKGYHFAQIGPVELEWREIDPGVVQIIARGGLPEDRHVAHEVMRAKLASNGLEHAQFEVLPDRAQKTANWDTVMAKAQRLVAAGNVQMLRNSLHNVVSSVQGDTDTYQVEFSRDDPNSSAITTWSCECPWSQYSWGRTRQWKKYEGRVCSHALATYWTSLKTPLDDAVDPANRPDPGPTQPPAAPPVPIPGPGAPLQAPLDQDQTGLAPRPDPAMTPPIQPPPSDIPTGNPSILPQLPQAAPLPVPNSIPGAYMPSPANPNQYPGGTFSKREWKFSADYTNGDIVQAKFEDWGPYVGRSDGHGNGQTAHIPAGTIGEVMGEDPTTGLVQVYFQSTPNDEMGKMEPYGIMGYFLKGELQPRPDIRKPGPAVRRRR